MLPADSTLPCMLANCRAQTICAINCHCQTPRLLRRPILCPSSRMDSCCNYFENHSGMFVSPVCSWRTNLCLQYDHNSLAAAAMWLAFKVLRIEPNYEGGEPWFTRLLGVDPAAVKGEHLPERILGGDARLQPL